MNISEIMTPDPISVQPSDTLLSASRLLRENGINHLPVVNGDGALVGIVSDRDLKKKPPLPRPPPSKFMNCFICWIKSSSSGS